MFIQYLTGLGTIIGVVVYFCGFNYIRFKVFKDTTNNPWDFVFMPFLAIIIVMVLIALPLVIGQAVMG